MEIKAYIQARKGYMFSLRLTRISRNAMSHLHCGFTLRAEWKHQFDTYLVKIHLVVHKIMSVLYFSLFLVIEILALRKNWTRKQEVGHCYLILQPFFSIR